MRLHLTILLKQLIIFQHVAFQKRHFGRVASTLEEKKINYLIIDPRNNYDVDEKSDNRNLNTYEQEYSKAYLVEKQKNKVNKIKERLELYIGKEEFKIIIKKMEDILDENGKV